MASLEHIQGNTPPPENPIDYGALLGIALCLHAGALTEYYVHKSESEQIPCHR